MLTRAKPGIVKRSVSVSMTEGLVMKSKIFQFALTFLLVLSASDQSLSGSQCFQESVDEQLRTLLETRRYTLRQVFELIKAEMDIGVQVEAELSTANLFLTEAELEIAESPAERVACLERAHQVYFEVERMVEARADIGAARASDFLLAKAARLKTKVELDEARIDLDETESKATADDTAEMRKTNDAAIHKLLQERYDTLKDAAQLIQIEVESGYRPIETKSRVNELLLEVTLELPDRTEDGIAILEQILSDSTNVEKQYHAYWKANNLYEKHYLVAKAARVEAAINLHRVKKGQWPASLGSEDSRASVTGDEQNDAELQALRVEYRDTLKTVQRLVAKDGNTGVAKIADMLNANHAYFNAELELTKSPQEQVAVLQEALKMQTEVERIARVKSEIGTLREAEYLPAKAARQKVEIELHRARKRAP